MDADHFYVNGQVVSFISLLIMIAFIMLGLRQRRQAGYSIPAWVIPAYLFLGLDAFVSIFLAGYQLTGTVFFYTTRRIFSLLSVYFIFLAVFDFPEDQPNQQFLRERRLLTVFMGGQIVLNAGWLVLNITLPDHAARLGWLDLFRNFLLPFSFLWLATLSMRRARSLRKVGDQETATSLARFGWLFWMGLLFSLLIFLRDWLPFAERTHAVYSSYGWMVICAGTALIFLGFKREERLLVPHVTLIILLILLLALGGVAEFFSAGFRYLVSPADIDRLLRPFILIQIGIVLITYLILPRWLIHVFAETDMPVTTKPLSPRQREVMRLLAEDRSNQQIAKELHITVRTAKHHISNLMRIYGTSRRYELGELARGLARDKLL